MIFRHLLNTRVAPYVGAWIETLHQQRSMELQESHPIWVCGLKQRKKSDFYSSKAPLRIAMSLVVNDFVSIDFVVQYSAKENGYRAISLLLPIRCVDKSLLRSLALLLFNTICIFVLSNLFTNNGQSSMF